jgi:hypothetical protein
MPDKPGFEIRNDHDEYADRPMPDPFTAMGWPLRVAVALVIFCAAGAVYFH